MQERCPVLLPKVLQDCVFEGWLGDVESISQTSRIVEIHLGKQQSDMHGQPPSWKNYDLHGVYSMVCDVSRKQTGDDLWKPAQHCNRNHGQDSSGL
jgi:hypothetical protein